MPERNSSEAPPPVEMCEMRSDTPALLIAKNDADLLRALIGGYGAPLNEDLRERLTAYAILHQYNNLTRYLGWSSEPITTMESLAQMLFPF